MSGASGQDDIERLVEKQARGEAAGLPVDSAAFGTGQLDTRRSKSGLAAGGLMGDAGQVEMSGAEVDSQAFIAHQTGIDQLSSDSSSGLAQSQSGVAHMPVTRVAEESDVNLYPDAVDRPSYIEAHSSSPVLIESDRMLAEELTPETQIQRG